MRPHGLFGAAVVSVACLAGTGHAIDTKTVNVNCATGQTIGQALDGHAKPGRALNVIINGTCNEHVVVTDPTRIRTRSWSTARRAASSRTWW